MALAGLLHADCTPDAKAAVRVLYIGFGDATSNAGFARFRNATRHVGAWPVSTKVQYLSSDRDDLDGLARAVTAELLNAPAVVVVPNSLIAEATRPLLGRIPMVFAGYSDPVQLKLVDAMNTPGRHSTGVFVGDLMDEKRLELLVEAAPGIRRVAVLMDRLWVEEHDRPRRLEQLGQQLGIDVWLRFAENVGEVDLVMGDPSAAQFDAWYLPSSQVTALAAREVIDHLRRLGKPAVFGTLSAMELGGTMAYTMDISTVWDTLADLTARVLNGEDPGTIPVERPRRYILSVRTGPETNAPPISPAVIRRADRIY